MTGFSREELIGAGAPHPYWPPEAYEEIERAFQKTLRCEFGNFELTLMRKNGERFPVIVSPSYIKNKQGNVISYFATVKDITERKRAEEAILKEKLLTDSIMNNVPAGIAFLDNDFVLRKSNSAYADLIYKYLSITPEQAFGISYFDYAPGSRDQVEEWFQKVRDSGQVDTRYGFKLVLKDDGKDLITYWDTSVAPVINTSGKVEGILILTRDVTERKRAEEALREAEKKYRNLVNNSNDIVSTADESGNWTFLSPAVKRILGYEPEEMVGRSAFDFMFPEDIASTQEAHDSVVREGRSFWEYENRWINKGGRIVTLAWNVVAFPDKQGNITGTQGVGRDITERKRAEEALTNSERKYRILVENIPQKIFYKDRNSVYVSCNQNYARDLGIKPEEIAGKTDYEFYPKEIAEKYRADDKRIMEGGQIEDIEEGYIHGGQDRVVQTFKVPVRDEKGNVMGVFAIFQDITERKKTEKELRANQGKLRLLASQMSLIEEQERRRIAIELHDSIGQSLALAKLKLEGMRFLDSFSYLVEPIDELLDIMNQTISQTRLLTSEISPPVLYELGLEPAIRWLGEKLLKQKGIIFEFISDGQPKPLTDDIRIILFQSVRELLVNILKHSHAKSVIVSIKRDGDYLQFTIEDDGIGFDTSRIVSTESFGIFNIRERIKLIGGSIEIQSEPGKGTQITIRVSLKR